MKINISAGSGGTRTDVRDDRPGRYSETRTETRQSTVSYKETPTSLDLTIEMPGTDPKSLDVSLKGRKLVVRSEKKEEARSSEGEHERVETRSEKWTKEVDLPCDVNPAKVDAVFKDGILKVNLEKAPGS